MIYTFIINTAILLIILERIPQLQFKPSKLFRRYFTTDIIYLLTGFIAGSSIALKYIIVGSAFLESSLGLPRLYSYNLPLWLYVPAALLLIDLGNYISHYLLHRFDILWDFHKIHHSSLTLDWLATFRSHILEQIIRRLTAPLLLILLGFPLKAVVIAGGIITAWAMFNHSNLQIDLRFIESIFITPRLHRIHHICKTSEKNFGTVFTFWDRLNGSFIKIDIDRESRFGNGEPQFPQTWAEQFISPIIRNKFIEKGVS